MFIMSPTPNLSLATRMKRIAKSLGYEGVGSISVTLQSSSGIGAVSLIVGTELPETAPVGTLVLDISKHSFFQRTAEGWDDCGSNPNANELLDVGHFTALPVTVPKLPTISAPVEDTSHIVVPRMVFNTHTAKFGADLSNLVVAGNGEIELFGGSRVANENPMYAAVELEHAQYELNVAESAADVNDCTALFGMAFIGESDRSIVGLYDISLVVENLANGRAMNFSVTHDSEESQTIRFYNAQTGSYLESGTDDVGTYAICESVNSYFKNCLRAESGYSTEAMVGNFRFTLTAVRAGGEFEPVVASWEAHIVDDNRSMIVPVVSGASEVVAAHNGEIALTGSVRYVGSAPIITGQNYSFNVQDSAAAIKSWEVAYNVELLNITNGLAITDKYHTVMRVKSAAGEIEFIVTDEIADGVIRIEDIDELLPEFGEHSNAPIGSYEFTLHATRKTGLTPDIICKWNAEVIDYIEPEPEPEPEPDPDANVTLDPEVTPQKGGGASFEVGGSLTP